MSYTLGPSGSEARRPPATLYLGAHWLTDVLGGNALGTAWIALVMATSLLITSPSGGGQAVRSDEDKGGQPARQPGRAA